MSEMHLISLEKDYVHEKGLDEGFPEKWIGIIFSLAYLEYHYGPNPKVSVLTQEVVTKFFTWMDKELGYSVRTQAVIATALDDFLAFAFETKYLENDLTGFIPTISVQILSSGGTGF